ncbi:MAG: DsbA family protein [Alphaproteobacteria bacterium]|nr:DsbA family protein [Alphaproteobacteria bacterium]MBU1512458.1 DsbA family protein [Alphaproteobacteria bacterium]MBU2095084.1 DsbA family protein [Alphaproteobacteria bacterium]MBU2151273.1 DsbA family protein [Alphaproteobacteria bacterium]MBU2308184.1 DsbA family protein [Alphaproteobacteria bacterium]
MKLIAPLAAVLVASLALSACNKPEKADPAFGAKVRAYLLEHPEVIEEAVVKLRQKQMLEQAKASASTVAKYRQQLERDPRDLVINPTGEFTVVEFFDYRCGYCKVVAPEVVKLMAENPDVRFVFKEFPIFGEVSDSAAKLALTPQGKTKGVELYKAWMSDKGLDEAALDRHLAEVGLDPAAVRKAANDPAIAEQIRDIRLLAGALGLQGTPAFVVGDYVIPGADVGSVRAALAKVKAAAMKRPGSPT